MTSSSRSPLSLHTCWKAILTVQHLLSLGQDKVSKYREQGSAFHLKRNEYNCQGWKKKKLSQAGHRLEKHWHQRESQMNSVYRQVPVFPKGTDYKAKYQDDHSCWCQRNVIIRLEIPQLRNGSTSLFLTAVTSHLEASFEQYSPCLTSACKL